MLEFRPISSPCHLHRLTCQSGVWKRSSSAGSLSCYYVASGTWGGNGNGICGWVPGYQYIGPNAAYLHGGFCCRVN